ncbi:hypothetical protein QFZ23_000746 [Arthrobacter globiformis]|uniref:hypothetical protein n=1 Tax=Arthrobacter globiformis TaxID=1665 RepID=UPI00278B6A7A|nr:hypothetical protein [Arthrobacter globiformis]MDQ1056845.1 hypothetical protein [Arthrobacter globiformis]
MSSQETAIVVGHELPAVWVIFGLILDIPGIGSIVLQVQFGGTRKDKNERLRPFIFALVQPD